MLRSKRKVKFNLTTRRTGRVGGTIESIQDRRAGAYAVAANQEVDILRYWTGLLPHIFDLGSLGKTIENIYNLPIPEEAGPFIINNNHIRIPLFLQMMYRIPFSEIFITDEETIDADTGGFIGSVPGLYEPGQPPLVGKRGNITLRFREVNHLAVFYNGISLRDFYKTGNFECPYIMEALASLEGDPDKEAILARRAQDTMRALGAPWISSVPTEIGTKLSERNRSESVLYEQSNIEYFAPVPETLIRQKLDVVSDMKFLVDENYNFFSGKYEQKERSPANREFGLVPETLLPSSYALASLNHLNSFEDNSSFINSAADEIVKDFTLDNKVNISMTRNTKSLTRNYFEKYSEFALTKLNENVRIALENINQKNKNILIVQNVVEQNKLNKIQFPFYNEIILLDAARSNVEFITRNLVDLEGAAGSPLLDKNCLLRLSSLGEMSSEIGDSKILQDATGESDTVKYKTYSVVQEYDDERKVTERTIRTIKYDSFLSSLALTKNAIILFDFAKPLHEDPSKGKIVSYETNNSYGQQARAQFSGLLSSTQNPFTSLDLNTIPREKVVDVAREIGEKIYKKSRENNFSIKDILTNKKNYFEIFAYRVLKTNKTTGLKQNFYILNTDKHLNSFIDSQLKYDQEYSYEVYAYSFSISNSYTYSNSNLPYISGGGEAPIGRRGSVLDFETTFTSKQNAQVIEMPVVAESSVNIDAPPNKPSIEFYPVKDSENQIQIRLARMFGDSIETPIIMENSDRIIFDRIKHNQKRRDDKIIFKTDETLMAFEVYRITTPPKSIRDFFGSKRLVQNTFNGKVGESVVITDLVQKNVEYYYLFRSIDNHGNLSNPTEIFKFTLVDIEGALQPLLETMPLDTLTTPPKSVRGLRSFLQVQPSTLQRQLRSGQFSGKSSSDITAVTLGTGTTSMEESSVIGNKFLLELASKNTGKIMYIELEYNVDNNGLREEEPGGITSAGIEAVVRRNKNRSRRRIAYDTSQSIPGSESYGFRGGSIPELVVGTGEELIQQPGDTFSSPGATSGASPSKSSASPVNLPTTQRAKTYRKKE